MNIFVLDNDPLISARMMDCQRVPKMCVESAQMMACAVIEWGATPDEMPLTQKGTPYSGGYKHHPCSRWASECLENFIWLSRHALELCLEYHRRFNKRHSCHDPIIKMYGLGLKYIEECGEMTPFAQAMPDEYKDDDAVKAYREYYKSKDNVHYRHTQAPHWFEPAVVDLFSFV